MIEQLVIENVSFQYPGGEKPVLRNVSLTIDKGDFIAIMGSNGSGKSTLCKLFNGLIPQYYVGDFFGTVTVNDLLTTEHKVAELSQNVGYVYQDFENQLVSPRVLDDASFAPLNYGHPDYKQKGKQALNLVGLHSHDEEFIWQLSGGQKHLLALAGVLSLDPDVLIIDEPVAQLDPAHAEETYRILKMLNEEYGKTIIVIEHHTEFIADYCKHIVLMEDGQVIWKKETADGLREVEQLMARQIYPPQVTQAAYSIDPLNKEQLPIHLEEAIPYFSERTAVTSLPSIPLSQPRKSIIQMENVSFSYKTINRSRKTVLKDLNLNIHKGDLIALVGNNGAGKSSLMRLITGLAKPETGQVLVKNLDTRKQSPEQLADLVTYIYQNPEEMFIEDSVRKDVEFFLKSRKISGYQNIVDRILEAYDLTHLQDRDSRLMSGGQQRRASLAIGVAMNPSVILLDEPTANLDIATRKHITRLIGSLKEQVESVVIATHDMQLVAEWANRIIVLHEGEIIHDGDRESVFQNQALLDLAGLRAPQILQLSKHLNLSPLAYTVDDFVKVMQGKESSHGIHPQTIG
ncbi:ATP-binding cassette domain-containing protein [Radiobacillus kanasensis]|uniref:ABC transporter ATP-binding protein n=1 Tax=Radiobacillus kanasensis TaxID=2844358 RepID=UPI001E402C58|nr:ABC transporter ATP-binding protein [Radiobacillus kanasensis]UFT99626.1 ATP-binding cassette domain-containing protein [Radiobacillus kanasensis]